MTEDSSTRRAFLRGSGGILAFAMAGCVGSSSQGDPNTKSVGMTDDLKFDPETVHVSVGTTVVWKNSTDASHTVTAYEDEIPDDAAYFASGGADSEQAARENVDDGLLRPDEQYEHTFEQTGQYGYFCIPHERSKMVGTVVVEE